ncbi:hypothetical protein MC885_014961 [Smutsia gigantea]|nr:hypothetical protein MC885_014961 [Smutsia gigantea]
MACRQACREEKNRKNRGALEVRYLFPPSLGSEWRVRPWHLLATGLSLLVLTSPSNPGVSLLQEDARTDAVDSVVRDIQNTQCLLNVEHLSAGCPHVTLQFADSKGDVGLGLVKAGLAMVEVRKEKQFQKVLNLWRYGDFRADDADEFGYSR